MPADSHPPQSFTLGNAARSTMATRAPPAVNTRAQLLPAGPPPTIKTS